MSKISNKYKVLSIKGVWFTFYLLFFTIILSTLYILPVNAQSDIAATYDLSGENIQSGDILIYKPETGISKSVIPYDFNIFGVKQDTPIAVFRRIDKTGNAVARSGIAQVNITTINGSIKTGDRITSSQIPGFGMKTGTSGYVLGVAMSSFEETDGQDFTFQDKKLRAGRIPVALKIEYAELTSPRSLNNFFSYLGTSFLQGVNDPRNLTQAVKYIFSGLILLIAISFSLVILIRSIPKSIEAIGRNPLARRTIMFSIILNIFIVIVITLAAILAAFIILRL